MKILIMENLEYFGGGTSSEVLEVIDHSKFRVLQSHNRPL